jgi:hypothetical protein
MLTRLAFVASLFSLSLCSKQKLKNNKCPSCGTMAAPYKITVSEFAAQFGKCAPANCSMNCSTICRKWKELDVPPSRMVRCTWCNAAFWQGREV